jgi:hypothetical protein
MRGSCGELRVQRARLPSQAVSLVLVQGSWAGGSFPTDRLVSLGCLIAFGFDLCRLIQRFERLGLLEDLRGVRVYGRLDR